MNTPNNMPTSITTDGRTNLVWIDPEGVRRWERVQPVDRSDDGAVFRSPQQFKIGQMVWIELKNELHRAAVRCCSEDEGVYRTGVLCVDQERRRSDRELIAGTATLQVAGTSTAAIIQNVTPDGVQIETKIKLPVSEVGRLTGENLECLGVIRYCQALDDHYVTGLEILQSFDRSVSEESNAA